LRRIISFVETIDSRKELEFARMSKKYITGNTIERHRHG
jgi:hypothetical protein